MTDTTFGDCVYKDVQEAILSKEGNDIVQKIVAALKEDKMDAKVELVYGAGCGYVIVAQGAHAYLQNSYDEDHDGLTVFGSNTDIISLRQPWFRDALRRIFRYDTEDALFESLLKDDFQYPPWRCYREACFGILPQCVFDDEILGKLAELNRHMDESRCGYRYEDYFKMIFREVLPDGFSLSNPSYPHLYFDAVDALWSMINEDETYEDVVRAAVAAANALVRQWETDPNLLKKKIKEIE